MKIGMETNGVLIASGMARRIGDSEVTRNVECFLCLCSGLEVDL